jgi:hypothetical protein
MQKICCFWMAVANVYKQQQELVLRIARKYHGKLAFIKYII